LERRDRYVVVGRERVEHVAGRSDAEHGPGFQGVAEVVFGGDRGRHGRVGRLRDGDPGEFAVTLEYGVGHVGGDVAHFGGHPGVRVDGSGVEVRG
jgi:hypothetical protein